MLDTEKVGKAITFLRKRAGYTQRDLAKRIGISDKAVSKWERGISLPDTALLGKLSILLDTDTDSLLAGDVIHHDRSWGGILRLDDNSYGINAGTMIFGKPLVYFLLGYFLLVGIKNIRIVCDTKSKEFIQENLGTGERFGIHLTFEDDFLTPTNYMVVMGRTVLYGVDQTRFFQRAMTHPERLTVLSLPKGIRTDNKSLLFDANRKIVHKESNNQVTTQYNYYTIPIFFAPAEYIKSVDDITSLSIESMQSVAEIYTEVLDRGFIELPIDTWEDVAEASAFIHTVQKSCGMEVYCIEEIAWRRGMITTEQFRQFGEEKRENPYGRYILSLLS